MAAEGQLASDASNVPTRLTIPRGVIEFIRGLIHPLAQDARNALDFASLIGPSRDPPCRSRGRERDAARAIDRDFRRGRVIGVIHEVRGAAGRYSFCYALIREALYDALPAAKRRRLHGAVAEAIRRLNASREPYAEIAYHYCQNASAGDADLAIEYSRQAARTAEKQLAYEEAAHHLNNAIAALALKRAGDDPIEGELFCDLGEAQFRAGDLSEARGTCVKAADIARRVKNPECLPARWWRLVNLLAIPGDRSWPRPAAERGARDAGRRGQPAHGPGVGQAGN